jgi:hypothetical protein
MAFQVILASAPAQPFEAARVSLDFTTPTGDRIHSAQLRFGAPSRVIGSAFDLQGVVRERPLRDVDAERHSGDLRPFTLDLDARIDVGGTRVGFVLKNLMSNDVLQITGVSPTYFLGNVLHGPRYARHFEPARRCIVTCSDGTSGQECVTCTVGGVTVRVCC